MRHFLRITIIVLGVGLAFEILLRALVTSPSVQVADPWFGFQYLPEKRFLQSSEGYAWHRTNSDGFVDPEWPAHADKPGIHVYGDSVIEALQVSASEGTVPLLRKALPGTTIYNFGHAGLCPVHYPILYERYHNRLPANRVIICITDGDREDLLNTGIQVETDANGQPRISLLPMPPEGPLYRIIRTVMHHSALATIMLRKYRATSENAVQTYQTPPWRWYVGDAPCGAYAAPAAPNPMERTPEAAAYLGILFKEIGKWPKPLIVYAPSVNYLPDGVATAMYPRWRSAVTDAARDAGIDMVDMTDVFRREYARGTVCHGFANHTMGYGHLNPDGHRAMVEAILDRIQP